MDIIKKLWAIRIANYYAVQYDCEKDIILDLEIEPVDKTTCIVINREIGTVNIFEMSGVKAVLAETFEEEEGVELFQLLTIKERK